MVTGGAHGSAGLARLVSIQVGLPATQQGADGRSRRTGYEKQPVVGPVWLGRTNLVGDGQGNRRVHGGPEMAVLAYAASHYPRWRTELNWPDLSYGAFAENFTITLHDERSVCIDDVYAVGQARLQVSQPRRPCVNIGRRWECPELTTRVSQTGRTGWYLRVVQEGEVCAGDAVVLLDRPSPALSVERAASRRR